VNVCQARKGLYDNKNALKKEMPKCDSSQSRRKSATNPTPETISPSIMKDKKLKKDWEFSFASQSGDAFS